MTNNNNNNNNDDTFGLNIVCEVPSSVNRRPKKKLNRYDKRRLRNERNQEVSLQEIQPQAQQQVSQDDEENKSFKEGIESASDVVDTHEQEPVKEIQQEELPQEKAEKESHQDNDGDDQSINDYESPLEIAGISSTKEGAEEAHVEEKVIDEKEEEMIDRPISRRNPGKMLLDETEERARYMAEFHARPREMDRRSGAATKRHIMASQPSNHLFVNDDNETPSLLPGLLPRLHQICQRRFHMTQPTWIQRKTWQHFFPEKNKKNTISGNVILMQSETGSGKTAAYLLPILQKLAIASPSNSKSDGSDGRKLGGTQCVILAPTRELTVQIKDWVEALTQPLRMIVGGCLSGGESRKSEKGRLRKGVTVLVATPGRWLDHYDKTESLKDGLKTKGWCSENNIHHKFLVLDESDRLLDQRVLGVQMQQVIQYLHHATYSKSQQWKTVLVSATLNEKDNSYQESIRMVLGKNRSELNPKEWTWIKGASSNKSIHNTEENSSNDDHNASTPRQLNQFHMMVTAKLRLASLIAFLLQRIAKNERTVVFMSTCDSVDYHYQLFQAMDCILPNNHSDEDENNVENNIFGCHLFRLHGKVQHAERHSILSKVSALGSGKKMVLLATDVAARGLNIGDRLDWTVQYDPPSEVAEYVHRVGRSARAGHAGNSLLFLLPSEQTFLSVLSQRQGNVDSSGQDWKKTIRPLSLTQTLQSAYKLCRNEDWLSRNYNKSKKRKNTSDNDRDGGRDGSRDGEMFTTELQKQIEDLVQQQQQQQDFDNKKESKGKRRYEKQDQPEGLQDLACRAYFSHLRAYPTKEKLVRHIFSARALHLGHLARSLGLREMPTRVKPRKLKSGQKRNKPMENEEFRSPLSNENIIVKKQKLTEAGKKPERKSSKNKRHINADGTVDTAMARRMLMDRAQQLQQGGMSSF